MKTQIILCLLFNICLLNAQIYKKDSLKNKKRLTTKVVTYNFKEGKFEDEYATYIKHNEPIALRIIYINRLAYQTFINANDIRIVDENLSDSLKKVKNFVNDDIVKIFIKENPSMNFTTNSLKTNTDNILDSKEKKQNKKQLSDLLQKLKLKENEIEKSRLKIKSLQTDSLNIEIQLQDILQEKNKEKISNEKYALLKTINSAESDIRLKTSEINNIYNEIDSIKSLIEEENSLQNEYNKLIDNVEKKNKIFTKHVQNMQNIISAYSNYIDFIKTPMLSKELYIRECDKYAILNNQNPYYGLIKEFTESYNDISEDLNGSDPAQVLSRLKEVDKSKFDLANVYITQLKLYVEDTYSKLKASQLNQLINNTQIADALLKTTEPYEFESNPIQPLEDMVQFNVQIKKNNETSLVKNFTYTEYVQKGVRWDFSVGAVFDFVISRQTYDLQNTGNNDKVKIVENNRNQFYPSLAGMLHSSFRTGNTVTWGISFGASLDISEFKLNSFFPGLSIMLGKREKTIITAGPSFSNVTQLKKYYFQNIDKEYDKTLDVNSITTNNFKIGFFVGITYNLTNKQRTKIKIL